MRPTSSRLLSRARRTARSRSAAAGAGRVQIDDHQRPGRSCVRVQEIGVRRPGREIGH
ncbi:hypothetical protein ABT075_16160 [Streptomyces sp. NPDC002677]|uniref:hypothetical protein n=1 Tax=Streptomyces sp. NPDC002677 TaxID=3154774 RepID=UPI00331EC014